MHTIEHIENTIPDRVPLILAPTASGKSLLEHIEERGRLRTQPVRTSAERKRPRTPPS